MKKTLRTLSLILAVVAILGVTLTGCKKKKEILILTSSEDYKIEFLEKKMEEKFPDYDIVFEYKSSGDHAAYLKASGKNSEYHITHDLEYGYLEELEKLGYLANLEGIVDLDIYSEDTTAGSYYVPELRTSGAVIINPEVMEEKGLDVPTSYEDLLDPQYKDLISMPNPASSGTGYMFLISLVNEWGEDEAFEYFDALSENVLSFTTSGSGPVNALITKEVAIGLGMTPNAVTKINEGYDLDILFFEEGSPYSVYGQGIVAGNEEDEVVVEVFKYLSGELTESMCQEFFPESIYRDKTFSAENYPSDIKYSDMTDNTPERKAELLKKWKY